jgi:membrane-associated phospholipid phosphatase
MKTFLHSRIVKLFNRIKLLSLELIIILAAFFTSAYLVVFLIRKVFVHQEDTFDRNAFAFFKKLISPAATDFMQFFTLFGSHYFLVPANLLLIAYSLFIKRDTWFTIKTTAVAFSSLILMFSLKRLFNRTRPLEPLLKQVDGLSFPSGHAFMSFTFFGLLIYMVYNRTKNHTLKVGLISFFLCMSIIVGISRIYLRVHYATDVLAGFAMGLIWLTLSLYSLHMIEKYKTKLPPVQ